MSLGLSSSLTYVTKVALLDWIWLHCHNSAGTVAVLYWCRIDRFGVFASDLNTCVLQD